MAEKSTKNRMLGVEPTHEGKRRQGYDVDDRVSSVVIMVIAVPASAASATTSGSAGIP